MTQRHDARARIDALLDERRDPLDDSLLQEWFAEHPEELAAYARFERRLGELEAFEHTPRSAPTDARAPRRRLLQLGALAVAALALLALGRRGSDTGLAPDAPRVAVLEPRILDFTLTITRDDGDRRVTSERRMGGPLCVTDTRDRSRDASAPRGVLRLRQTLKTETNR